MRAIVIASPGGPEVLELREVGTPVPVRGEVRVRVRATAVNRADLLQRMGLYPAPPDAPADIPGLEFAGEIDAVGDGVTDFAIGDRVFGLAGGGTYAEYLIAHPRALARIPERMSHREAAAVPEAFITAYDAMVVQGELRAGECALIHAVGSGVGTAAVQIARALGARAIGTSRTAEKLDRAAELGMDGGVIAENGAFAAGVRERSGGEGVDVVLELVGGAYLAEDLRCVRSRGRIVLVGLMAGARCELDLAAVLRKRIAIRGTVLRSRPLEEKLEAGQLFARHLVPLLARGDLRPVVDCSFSLADAAEAHRYVADNRGFGKVVLELD